MGRTWARGPSNKNEHLSRSNRRDDLPSLSSLFGVLIEIDPKDRNSMRVNPHLGQVGGLENMASFSYRQSSTPPPRQSKRR